jgi:hypothetical protein
MKTLDISEKFPYGILRQELFLGVASSISARSIGVNLSEAGRPSGSHYSGSRYGRGEVGEFVLVEGQQCLLLGRISEIRLREQERRSVKSGFIGENNFDAIGQIQLLGSISLDELHVTTGVETYPRLGDRIYAAPHRFISLLPLLMEKKESKNRVSIGVGFIESISDSKVSIKPEKLFGRHCAILGSTGGGKSWTTARIIEECLKFKSKIILLDATGEYRDFYGQHIENRHLGSPIEMANDSKECSLPPTSFVESDFIALFEPSGKVQGPKLRAAMKSLRLAKIQPILAPNGYIQKINQTKTAIETAERDPANAAKLDDPAQEFDVFHIVNQIEQECVYPDGFGAQRGTKDLTRWGGEDGNFSHCLSLVARINGVLSSLAFTCVFKPQPGINSLTQEIDEFINSSDKRLLRICMGGIGYEFKAREIIANVIGRHLLNKARKGEFRAKPAIVIVDEAHNFLGRHIGTEDYIAKLDAFEIIAKEGRKYGLNICLATQRPRDITEGVLSQIGTLIVHRLTNDKDREVVERACGEIDKAASAFLPNLRPGQAAIIGADFPIPLTVQIEKPGVRPKSDGPDYQKHWTIEELPDNLEP